MRTLPITVATLLAACSESGGPGFLDLSSFGKQFALVAAVDEEGRTLDSVLVDLDLPGREGKFFSLPADARGMAVLFDRSDLMNRVPRLDVSRVHEFRVGQRSEHLTRCPEGRLDADASRVEALWPNDSHALTFSATELEPSSASLESGWFVGHGLSAPVVADRCHAHPDLQARRFSTRQPILQTGDLVGGVPLASQRGDLGEVERLDETHVLLAYAEHVLIAERDVGFVDAPGKVLLATPGWTIGGVSAGPRDPETGEQRLAVLEWYIPPPDLPALARIRDATIQDALLMPGATLLEPAAFIESVLIPPSTGRILAFERPSSIIEEMEPGGPFRVIGTLPPREGTEDKIGRLTLSGDPNLPIALLGSHRGTVLLGNTSTGEWQSLASGLTAGLNYRGFARATPPSQEPLMFTGNQRGELFTRSASAEKWTRIEARLDPRLIPVQCAFGDPIDHCGFAAFELAWEQFVGFTDATGSASIIGLPDLCSLVFLVSASGCTTHFFLDEALPLGRDLKDELRVAHHAFGFITIASESGYLYEIPFPDSRSQE